MCNGVNGAVESFGIEILETSTGDLGVEVFAVEQRVNLDGGLSTVGESSLSTLAGSPESSESAGITREVYDELVKSIVEEVIVYACPSSSSL